ncbi:uncharacterized protein LOC121421471 [Lytechinus variegatus]|uniref:uncharacterized protein LOC121421471 n=1 Tax=Lytechinus variegatus TaxID=7654 RepID=UPI001BB248F2|nr:uncharacterized protein LOC121421471 [Lytechinus variegatus]
MMATLVFILVLTLASCAAKIMYMYAREGEMVLLEFVYPCNSTITLQYGNRAPCYSSAKPKHMSMPPNQRLAFENVSEVCSVQWTIDPVSRDEAGTYILTTYKNGIILTDFPIIGLRIGYPPGQASCEIGDYHQDEEWISLQCTALLGTLSGGIYCYQQGLRLPKRNDLIETPKNLKQNILARHDSFVHCCSSMLDQIKDKCNCTDWGWDPISDTIFAVVDPCPEVSTELQTSVPEPPTPDFNVTEANVLNDTVTTETVKYPNSNKNMYIAHWIMGSISIIITITIWSIIVYKRRRVPLENNSPTSESRAPCLPNQNENETSFSNGTTLIRSC